MGDSLLVVADGVGGWAEKGVNSGLFSRELCQLISQKYDSNPFDDLKQILIESCSEAQNIGSSTAVLVKLDPKEENVIKTCNLGDSGYVVYRVLFQDSKYTIKQIAASKEQ